MSHVNAVIEFDSLNDPPEGFYASAMGWYFHGELQDMVGFDIPSASVDRLQLSVKLIPELNTFADFLLPALLSS